MSKKLMLAMEKKDFSVGRDARPYTSGGRTMAKGNGKAMDLRKKERGSAISAIKMATAKKKAAYNASRK